MVACFTTCSAGCTDMVVSRWRQRFVHILMALLSANATRWTRPVPYEIDREVVQRIQQVAPEMGRTAWDNRNF